MDQTNEPRRRNTQKSDIWTKNHKNLLPQQTYLYKQNKRWNKTRQRYQHPSQVESGQKTKKTKNKEKQETNSGKY